MVLFGESCCIRASPKARSFHLPIFKWHPRKVLECISFLLLSCRQDNLDRCVAEGAVCKGESKSQAHRAFREEGDRQTQQPSTLSFYKLPESGSLWKE